MRSQNDTMSSPLTITVDPIYGWGWVVAGKPRPPGTTPKPFTISVEIFDPIEPKRWVGKVVDRGHEFEGQRVTLTQRHVHWSGAVNVAIEPRTSTAGDHATGFARLPTP
jgi:hypothetical protein